ncbi:structural maintenance of chromosome (SMC ATPase family) [Galdieria sulphuraria]|uniref:Structural maintenance of chromosomes protein n=1 Tax=Galdieria sulphuraria TaxID=130081 RepID=M2XA30_GALSU|nr:structural maintenance of chromosome (SMC ATPase family) [Galdieria sulphuraria]EME26732.1 structural maintenance of chromosome (SMC ATPase family) [Galdieria sulphuraria]|eukprot:XP_005703252.1 structural maintenance of chromosome (SMC ATPase family) [Galdieria sulphuraria]
MVVLRALELENFKTYHPKVRIETKGGFNAVVGPNGCGKSNFMDALSFALGCRASSVRGKKLEDLISNNIREKYSKGKIFATVRVIFSIEEEEAISLELSEHVSRLKDDEQLLLTLSRTITGEGTSDYAIAEKKVLQHEYFAILAKLGLRNNAQTFLVFQNQIESVAFKTPKDLTAMFEELSDSIDLKAQYEEALQQKQRLDEESALFFQQRKALSSERKRYKEQSAEAQHYRELEERLNRVKSTKSLLQLYKFSIQRTQLENDLKKLQHEIESNKESLQDTELKLQQQRTISANASKSKAATQKKLERLLQEVENLHLLQTTKESQKQEIDKQLANKKRSQAALQEKISTTESEISKLRETLEDIEQAIQITVQDIANAKTECTLSLEDYEIYKNLKREVASKTSFLKQELETLQRNEQLLSQQKRGLEQKLEQAISKQDACIAEKDKIEDQIKRAYNKLEQMREDAESKTLEKQQMITQRNEMLDRRRQLEQTLRVIQNELIECGAILHENNVQTKMEEAFTVMKRVFPGIKGKLRDLVYPIQSKYRTAFQVVFGNFLDAVVVDNSQTGAECISYLKQQRLGSMLFLPLADIRPKPIQEDLRRLGGSCKLLADVLNCQPQYLSAMRYAAGSTVICDSLEEARQVFSRVKREQRRRIKVSLDGTVINKSGFITGGYFDAEEADKSTQRQRIEELRTQQGAILDELSHLTTANISRLDDKIEKIANDISNRQSQVEVLERELDSLKRRKRQLSGELSTNLNVNVDKLRYELDDKNRKFSDITQQVQIIAQQIRNYENQTFSNFLTKFGLSDSSTFEQKYIQGLENLSEKRNKLDTQKVKLSRRLEYENDSLRAAQERLKILSAEISSTEESSLSILQEEESARKQLEQLEREVVSLRATLQNLSSSFEQENERSRNLRKQLIGIQEQINLSEKQLGNKQEEFNELKLARSELLRSCLLNETSIPLKDNRILTDDDAIPEDDELDFDNLSRRYRDCKTDDDFAKVINEMEENEHQIVSELDKIAPNLLASDKLLSVKTRIEEVVQKYEATRQEAMEATRKFQKIREERRKRFLSCFNVVSANIDRVYKELTRTSVSQLGGTAYLALENYEEPYLYGIKYHAMPPAKRFRDMEQLSGGEKTLAALALIFAIQAYRPSPFIVLDEVDAALDRDNLDKVARFILQRSRMNSPKEQYVVISLKDKFYEMADSLIGIYRDMDRSCSGVLSLDLNQFGEAVLQ